MWRCPQTIIGDTTKPQNTPMQGQNIREIHTSNSQKLPHIPAPR